MLVAEYFGQDLSPREYWLRELQIHAAHREGEADLRDMRWFDHRPLLAAQATYLFAAQYRYEYLEAYKRVVDIRTVGQVQPFSPEDIFESAELVPMWLARRAADQIGCKYDFFLHYIFERFAARGWKHLPRPNQLYAEEMVDEVEKAWHQRCREVLQLASADFYSTDHYVAHPDQDQYHAYLIGHIMRRAHKDIALACVLKKKLLPLELAGKEFGVDTLRRAHRQMAMV